jgi:Cyclic phosphodiesterase-like protein
VLWVTFEIDKGSLLDCLPMNLLSCGSLALISTLLIGHHQIRALSMAEHRRSVSAESTSGDISVSLWLIPSASTSLLLAEQIDQFSQGGTRGPRFAPHITIVGGIECRSEEHILEVANTLEAGLAGFGKIPCTVSPKAYAAPGAWNQALHLVVEPSAALLNLCQRARALLGMDTENWTFPPPSNYPHISMFYGIDNIPDKSEVQSVSPFYAYTLALWRTDPPSLEGVEHWREIRVFDIV